MSSDEKATRTPLISLKEISKSYRLGETTVQALRGLSLDIYPGEFSAIVGPSGSGKSTLFNLLGCLDVADSGTMTIGGLDVSRLSEEQKSRLRNQKIGFVFQSFNLIPVLNIVENIEMPLLIQKNVSAKERRARALKLIEDVGLKDHINHTPSKLSGGQRQRVAIARALVTGPALVLADEPTANLDSDTTAMIVTLMSELNEKYGVTFLFSTHDENLMSCVKRIIRVRNGVVVDANATRQTDN